MGNMLIAQSGGPTCAANASLAGAVQEALVCTGIGHIYGALNGIQGLLSRSIIDLKAQLKTPEDFDTLARTPAMALGSCRLRLPREENEPELYKKIDGIFSDYGISYFFYIGGNDSMDTVDKLSRHFAKSGRDVRVVGIPKTIDNDLPMSDHSPGFGSAAKFIATSMLEIIRDCNVYDTDSVTVVEIMGRNAGWLTAAAALPRTVGAGAPHLVYLPEVAFDPESFLRDVKEIQKSARNCIVAVSEGVRLESGAFAGQHFQSGVVDAFGHSYLSGIGKYLETLVREKIGCKVRSIELNVLQRCSCHAMSATDLKESLTIGKRAVRAALDGKTGVMMAFRRISDQPYMIDIDSKPVSQIANRERLVPKTWICEKGNDIDERIYEYLLPLIKGEVPYTAKNGMPVHFVLRKTIAEP